MRRLLFVLLVLAACANDKVTVPPRADITLSRFRVPVPAHGVEGFVDESSTAYGYDELSLEELAAFYDRWMPKGRTWHGLEWCETSDISGVHRRSWRDPGTDDFLLVDLLDDNGQASVQVFDDRDDVGGCAG